MIDLLKWFGGNKEVLSEVATRELVTALLLEMVMADGDADKAELDHVVHLLALRYGVPDSEIQSRVDAIDEVTGEDIDAISQKLREGVAMRDRVLLLRDLWSVALANGIADAYEERLFHQVADRLGIDDQQFLDKCIKVALRH